MNFTQTAMLLFCNKK